jgi:predicted dehydrogenase
MPIDVALLGCGHPHVPDVLGVIASEPDVRLVAVWDADPSAIPTVIADLAVGRAETAIRRGHVTVICAPTDQRPALVSQAARAGRPVLVQAPLGRTAAEAREVHREVQRSRTPAAALLPLRELPALHRLRGLLAERLLGRISAVSATLTHAGALAGWFDGPVAWMRDPVRAGVGGFGELGLQLIDAVGTLPADEPPRLTAVALDRDGARRTDVGGAALGTWGGVPLIVRTSWATRPGGLELVVTGATGTATVRDGVLEVVRETGAPERWVGAPPDPGEAVRGFLQRLRADRLARDGLAPAVRAQEVVEAALTVR